MIGKKLDVLFEHENQKGKMSGFSSNYVRVSHVYNESFTNGIYPIKIASLEENMCSGKILDIKNAVDLVA
jgi:tRNA A37 methylthiotransferase MiaB